MEGARILGADLVSEGIEINRDAAATAIAAGHPRRVASIEDAQVGEYEGVTGLIASTPCPTLSDGGLRTGRGRDYQHVLDTWTSVGWGIGPVEALTCVDGVQDRRTALLALAGVWALTLPNLEWLAFEQVPAAAFAWEDLIPELTEMGWEWADFITLDAADFGLPARRKRTYLVARYSRPATVALPWRTPEDVQAPTMAQALGWDVGHAIVTRGNRRPTGGNRFTADGPSWCLTGRSRSWEREDGLRLTPAQAGILNGFRADYPWQGSRTAQFQQAGDVVSPVIAAHILGTALGIEAAAPHR